MLRNFVFDLGGVIITIDTAQAKSRFVEMGFKDMDSRLDAYTQQGYFGQLEDGSLSAEEFIAKASEETGRRLSFSDCKYCWLGYRKEVPQRNLETMLKLRRSGLRVIVLSNTNPFMMDWAESNDFDSLGHSIHYYADAVYQSYEMKVMKPAREAFSFMLEHEGIKPDETLFVDDGQRNVDAANSCGIHTLKAVNGEDWTQKVLELAGETDGWK